MTTTIRWLCVAVIALAVAAIVVTVLQRLTDDALAVVGGVSCGIVASIPVSLGLLIALTRSSPYTGGGTVEVEGNRWTGYRTQVDSPDPIIVVMPVQAAPANLPDRHTKWIEPRQ